MVSLRGRWVFYFSCRKVGSEDIWNLVKGILKIYMGFTVLIRVLIFLFLCEVLLKFENGVWFFCNYIGGKRKRK